MLNTRIFKNKDGNFEVLTASALYKSPTLV